jgi:hypothetical protein
MFWEITLFFWLLAAPLSAPTTPVQGESARQLEQQTTTTGTPVRGPGSRPVCRLRC